MAFKDALEEVQNNAAQVISDAKQAVTDGVRATRDPRFNQVEDDESAALNELDETYGGMIDKPDKFIQDQINASKEWADKQAEIQNQQTDFTIEQIEQQRQQAEKDYKKEQSGAFVDWKKQSNQYGVNAEAMAAQGMAGTGFSESSQVSMYTAYQNRIATAREIFNQATLNYNNAIKDAKLQNSSVLAEIAYNAYKEQVELGIKAAMYKDELLREKTNRELEIKQMYYQRWQDVLDQINKEKALAEERRQFDILHPEGGGKITDDGVPPGVEIEEETEKMAQEVIANAIVGLSGSGGSGNHTSAETRQEYRGQITGDKTGNSANAAAEKADEKAKSGKPPVDMDSVLALGFGPISANEAFRLEKEGIVESYVKDGKTYFRKVDQVHQPGSALSRFT